MNIFIGCASEDIDDSFNKNSLSLINEIAKIKDVNLVFGAYHNGLMGKCYEIFKDNNIYSIAIKFKSSKTITFIITSAISPFLNNMEHNMYQKEYIFNNSKALLISEYKVKNITSLFI